jgi:hypothetical protein
MGAIGMRIRGRSPIGPVACGDLRRSEGKKNRQPMESIGGFD